MNPWAVTTDERLARLEEQLRGFRSEFERRMAAVMESINGPPWLRSLRGRLHELEGEAASAKAASRALAEAQREHREARAVREETEHWRWSNAWKWVAALTALAALVLPYLLRWF